MKLFSNPLTKHLCDPSVPFLNELQIIVDPMHVLIDILRERILFERLRIHPHYDFRTILVHAVLQQEEVDIALEIDEQVEESPILLQAPRQRAILPFIESVYALHGQVPSVPYQFVRPAALVDAVSVSGEDDRSSDRVRSADYRFHPSSVIVHRGCDFFDHGPVPLVSEPRRYGIAGEPHIVPCEVIASVSFRQIHYLTVGKFPAPQYLVVLAERRAAGVRIVPAVSETVFAFPESVPETFGIRGEIEVHVNRGGWRHQ